MLDALSHKSKVSIDDLSGRHYSAKGEDKSHPSNKRHRRSEKVIAMHLIVVFNVKLEILSNNICAIQAISYQ